MVEPRQAENGGGAGRQVAEVACKMAEAVCRQAGATQRNAEFLPNAVREEMAGNRNGNEQV